MWCSMGRQGACLAFPVPRADRDGNREGEVKGEVEGESCYLPYSVIPSLMLPF